MNNKETEYRRFVGYKSGSKKCFDIELKHNAIISNMTLRGLPLYDTFKLIDTSRLISKKDEDLCVVDRQYVNFANEFISNTILRENIRKMQNNGIEKIIIEFTQQTDMTTHHLETWSELIKSFRAEFTFDDDAMPLEHELFVMISYKNKKTYFISDLDRKHILFPILIGNIFYFRS